MEPNEGNNNVHGTRNRALDLWAIDESHLWVIGQGSSIELAALGPGTVLCDYMSYVLMFLSVATSNMVATSLAREIRGLAWPAVLVGWVAESASLGMKDSWGPLKTLTVATAVNGIGDIVLCSLLGYGIAGAAWATMVSQVVAAFMMINSLNKKGFNAFSISIPSPNDLLTIFGIAAPVFVMMMAKVMIQTYTMCTVWGESPSQTAQSFIPELLYGINKNLPKARMLLKSLVTFGASLGLLLGIVGTSVPWLFPNIFTSDQKVIQEMHKVVAPYFIALAVTPATLSLEGTLLAGRDLKFVSLSMNGCFSLGAIVLLLVSSGGYGLPGCWYALLGFQWAPFFLSLQRLLSPHGILHSEDLNEYKQEKLKAA
ncbi:hypothetical protein CRYUN_Cryun10bG0135700 [Craigia yunnanensis]